MRLRRAATVKARVAENGKAGDKPEGRQSKGRSENSRELFERPVPKGTSEERALHAVL
jgi:hypothetical protein